MTIFYQKTLILITILALLIMSFFSLNLNLMELFNLNNWLNILYLFKEFITPNLSYEFI